MFSIENQKALVAGGFLFPYTTTFRVREDLKIVTDPISCVKIRLNQNPFKMNEQKIITTLLKSLFEENKKDSLLLLVVGTREGNSVVELKIKLPLDLSQEIFVSFLQTHHIYEDGRIQHSGAYNRNHEELEKAGLEIVDLKPILGYTGHYDHEAGISTGDEIYGNQFYLQKLTDESGPMHRHKNKPVRSQEYF